MTDSDYNRFVKEGLKTWSEESPSNVKHDFKKMARMFGYSYIYWLKLQLKMAKDGTGGFTVDEMMAWNGNVPKEFIQKLELDL